MTEQNAPDSDPYLIQLIVSFQSAAMLQLGKIMNPMTGKVDRDLDQAKNTIELLATLQRKTEGNLSEDEKRLLDHVLYELRMNYIDEADRPAEEPSSEETPESESTPEPDAGGGDTGSAGDDSA